MAAPLPKGCHVYLPTPSGVKRWRIAYRRMRAYGETNWDSRTIWLRPNQTREELIDTIIHEALHVATGLGDTDEKIEDCIMAGAQGSTAILLKLKLIALEDE